MKANAPLIVAAVAIGYVLAQLITAIANGLVAPLIGAIVNKDDFISQNFTLNGNQFPYGYLIGLAISLVLAVAIVYPLLAKQR